MTKKLLLGILLLLAFAQRPHAQAGTARIFFVDIGQGAGTLIVSPTGKTLLVDGGPPGGGAKIGALLDTLGIATIDYTVLTHYHIDHDSGLIELLNAGRVAGIAYDNGDGAGRAAAGNVDGTDQHARHLSELRHGDRARRRDATDDRRPDR